MRKILPLLLLTMTFLFSSQMGVVHSLDPNGDGFLSIRTKPKGKEIGRLYNGNKVKILSKKGKYYKIKKVSSGKVGYAHSNWIRKTSSTSTSQTSTASSNKEGVVHGLDPHGDGFLALRAKYKTGRQIGKLYEGDKVKILAKRGKWYKVKTVSAGQVGWAHGNWVKAVNKTNQRKQDIASKTNYEYDKFIVPTQEACRAGDIYHSSNSSKNRGKVTKYGCASVGIGVFNSCSIQMGLEPVSIYDLTKIVHKCGGKIGDGFITDSYYRECIKKNNIDIKGKYITRSSTQVFGGLSYSLDFFNTSIIPYSSDDPERYILCINPKPYEPPPFPIPWVKPKDKVISKYQKDSQWNYKTAKKICQDLNAEIPSMELYKYFMGELGVKYGDSNAKNNEHYLGMLDNFGFNFDGEYITSTAIEGESKHKSINFYVASGYEGAAEFGGLHRRATDDTDKGFLLMCIKKGYNDRIVELQGETSNKKTSSDSPAEVKSVTDRESSTNSSLITSNKNEKDCSQIADWLMKGMPDHIKEKCNKANTQQNNNTPKDVVDEWITPSRTICENNGGKVDDNGHCTSNWADAKKVCNFSSGRLPTIVELESLVSSSGGSLNQDNKNNLSYSKCYKEKGFIDDVDYWSSSLTEISYTPKLMHVSLGSKYSGGKYTLHSVMCHIK